MSIKEKVAYLRGLAEGVGLDSDVKAEKLVSVIIETLEEMAEEVDALGQNSLDIGDELDAISDDLADVEEFLFGDEDDEDFDGFEFDDFDDDFEHDDDDENGCGCSFCGGSALTYEVACPACGAEIELDESDLILESISCPNCNEVLEFDFDDDFDDEDFDDEEITDEEE